MHDFQGYFSTTVLDLNH